MDDIVNFTTDGSTPDSNGVSLDLASKPGVSLEIKKRGRKKKLVDDLTTDLSNLNLNDESTPVKKIRRKKIKVESNEINSIYSKFFNMNITEQTPIISPQKEDIKIPSSPPSIISPPKEDIKIQSSSPPIFSNEYYFYYSTHNICPIDKYEENKIYLLMFKFYYIENDNHYILHSTKQYNDAEIISSKSIYINNIKIHFNKIQFFNINNKLLNRNIILYYNLYPIENISLNEDERIFNNILDINNSSIMKNHLTLDIKFKINDSLITFRNLLDRY